MVSATLIFTSMLFVTSIAMAGGQSAAGKALERSRLATSSASQAMISTPAVATATTPIASPDGSTSSSALYTVKDGNKVDAQTLAGWKTWRALACERCHGAAQEGLVGPSLLESLKRLTKEEFHTTIMNGRLEKGMPSFSSSRMVTENWEGLYAYLKGRSDGKIQPGHLSPLEKE
jgi:mono/diheme cytochrome c family protein